MCNVSFSTDCLLLKHFQTVLPSDLPPPPQGFPLYENCSLIISFTNN